MEEERVRAVSEAARCEQAAREHAQREAEERARRESEARERAEADARREIERRAHEEAARIDAIRRAAADAARFEAEARVKLEARDRELRHALELERIGSSARGGSWHRSAGASLLGAVVAAGIALALHLGVILPQERARASAAGDELASRDVAVADLRARAASAEARAKSLEEDVAAAGKENERLRADLDAARHASGPLTTTRRAPMAPHGTEGPRLDGFTACAPGSKDPLCLQ